MRPDGLYWCEYREKGPQSVGGIHEGLSVTFLGGNMAMGVVHARLFRLTGQALYKTRALRTADAILAGETDGKGHYLDDRDAYANGYFMGEWGREVLSLADIKPEHKTLLCQTAVAIREHARTSAGYYGGCWNGPAEGEGCTWWKAGTTDDQFQCGKRYCGGGAMGCPVENRRMTTQLEHMLCDCCVIRTTFETLDLFPAEDPIRAEILEIIHDARANLRRRCAELRGDIIGLIVLDRPLDVEEFSKVARILLVMGHPRRRLDAFMKVNVFQSIAEKDAGENKPDLMYRYELLPPLAAPAAIALNAQHLTAILFDDLLRSMETDTNYADKYAFDCNIFQKYVAIMFACYAATDPLFYR